MNKHAQLLGRLSRGKKKNITDMERKRRGEQGAIALRAYHAAKKTTALENSLK